MAKGWSAWPRSKGHFRQNPEATSTAWLLVLSEACTQYTCTLLWCLTHHAPWVPCSPWAWETQFVCLLPWAPYLGTQCLTHSLCSLWLLTLPATPPSLGSWSPWAVMCSPAAHSRWGPRAGKPQGWLLAGQHTQEPLVYSHEMVRAEHQQQQSVGCPLCSFIPTETWHPVELQSMISSTAVGRGT